jgi:Calcium binding
VAHALDPEREQRIEDEIIVDCYDEYEVAVGWFAYLEDHLPFPFQAMYHPDGEAPRQVLVLALEYDEDDLESSALMFDVEIDDDGETWALLEDITPPDSLPDVVRAVEDWRYWLARGQG